MSSRSSARSASRRQAPEKVISAIRDVFKNRGATGIRGFSRSFKIWDDDGDHRINEEEFTKGLHDYGIHLEKSEIRSLFKYVDFDGSGFVQFEEMLAILRPPLPHCRILLIEASYRKMDKTGDGLITCEDIEKTYDVSKHPKYLSGEMTKKDVLKQFLKTFDLDGDAKVTKQEWIDYYTGVSNSIDNDAHFDLMMRNAWKL